MAEQYKLPINFVDKYMQAAPKKQQSMLAEVRKKASTKQYNALMNRLVRRIKNRRERLTTKSGPIKKVAIENRMDKINQGQNINKLESSKTPIKDQVKTGADRTKAANIAKGDAKIKTEKRSSNKKLNTNLKVPVNALKTLRLSYPFSLVLAAPKLGDGELTAENKRQLEKIKKEKLEKAKLEKAKLEKEKLKAKLEKEKLKAKTVTRSLTEPKKKRIANKNIEKLKAKTVTRSLTEPKKKRIVNKNKTIESKPAEDWKKYKSVAAAKKGNSLYFSKNGVKKIAVTKEELDKSGLTLTAYINKKLGKTSRKAKPKVKSGTDNKAPMNIKMNVGGLTTGLATGMGDQQQMKQSTGFMPMQARNPRGPFQNKGGLMKKYAMGGAARKR